MEGNPVKTVNLQTRACGISEEIIKINPFIPLDSRNGSIWMDGQIKPWSEAKIHILSHGLHYASSVFEGIRVYDGSIFKLEDHVRRLISSATILGFTLPYNFDQICQSIYDTVSRQRIQNGYIRPLAWLGSEDLGIYSTRNKAHLAIAAWEWEQSFLGFTSNSGVQLSVARWIRPSLNMAPIKAKAAGFYMVHTICRREAQQNGFDDALFLDHQGFVAEATAANIFLVKDGELRTPTPNSCLDGITRRTVMDIASKIDLRVLETNIRLEDLALADEIFLTGTAYEIQPVTAVDSFRISPGPITRSLYDLYRTLAHVDQIKEIKN